MKNKIIFFCIVVLLALGTAGLNIFWLDNYSSQKYSTIVPKPPAAEKTENVFNKKEGWGFVKARGGKYPEVTAHQRNLVKKYGALFMGDVKKKQVTLTFDMGYEKQGLTPKILETLKKCEVKGSFFVTTYWIEKNPELAKQLVAEGHLLENHTVRHKSLPTLTDEQVRAEISGWEEVAREIAGYTIKHKYMRPPMGEYSERTLKITREMGYRTAFWSIAIKDWVPMGGPDKAVNGVLGQLHNGAVILLHGNSEDSVAGLEQMINQMKAKGYKIVPLNEI